MSKRVTVMIDDDVDTKVRKMQSKQIAYTSSSVSFSRVMNELLRKALR